MSLSELMYLCFRQGWSQRWHICNRRLIDILDLRRTWNLFCTMAIYHGHRSLFSTTHTMPMFFSLQIIGLF